MNYKNLMIIISLTGLFAIAGCSARTDLSVSNPEILSSTAKSSCEPLSYHTGNTADLITPVKPGLVLMGGGKDVDEAFKWMIQRSGGGDFVILRSSGSDGYNDYIYKELGGVNSVETLVIDSREKANCPSVASRIKKAEALFIAGGDQSNYYNFWKNSSTQKAIEYLVKSKKAPVGGTSAGMAVLGQLVYTAEKGSITSASALKNPFDDYITLKNDFLDLPLMQGIITDTHFTPRERPGRLITFMAQAVKTGMVKDSKTIKGIGVDENTAATIDENGNARIFGSASAWFFRPLNGSSENCTANSPLTWDRNKKAVKVSQLKGTPTAVNSFNIVNWSLINGEQQQYDYYVKKGLLSMQ